MSLCVGKFLKNMINSYFSLEIRVFSQGFSLTYAMNQRYFLTMQHNLDRNVRTEMVLVKCSLPKTKVINPYLL